MLLSWSSLLDIVCLQFKLVLMGMFFIMIHYFSLVLSELVVFRHAGWLCLLCQQYDYVLKVSLCSNLLSTPSFHMIKLAMFSHDHSSHMRRCFHMNCIMIKLTKFSNDHSTRTTEFHASFLLSNSTEFSHDHSSRTAEFSLEFFMINSTDGYHMSFHMINRPSFHKSFHMIKSTEFSH